MTERWLLRMARWARRPPSANRVRLVLGVLALCLLIAGLQKGFGWPEALTVNGPARITHR